MSIATATFAFSLFATIAFAVPPETPRIELQAERGLGDKSYAPWQVDCPSNVTWIRNTTVSCNILVTKMWNITYDHSRLDWFRFR